MYIDTVIMISDRDDTTQRTAVTRSINTAGGARYGASLNIWIILCFLIGAGTVFGLSPF